MISKRLITVALGSAILGLLMGYLVLPPLAQQDAPQPPVPVEAPAPLQTRELPESEAQIQLSFAPVVRNATPSVVNVYATTVTQETVSPFAADPFFRRFFGDGGMLRQRPRQSQSLGSGVIVDASGVILTNSHVVEGATDIRIATADGREFAVELVLDDPETDLAVLRVRDPADEPFAALRFADSDGLEVGDLVLAIGNPFGVGQTVTSGIVSALARTGVEGSNYEFFIQTDAAINPGNSGGALIDLSGRLVGINTAIFTRTGGSIGIGFAIPANMARVVAEAGIAGGTLVRPWFGALMQEVTADIADSLGLERPVGALITEVAPGGSAEAAGLQAGDVIVSVDGFPVQQPSAFDFRLATQPIGGSVEIAYFRDGRQSTVTVELQAPPGSGEIVEITGNTRFRGVGVATMTPAIAEELGLPYSAEGVVVRSVTRGSPADAMGLQTGDVILNLNGRDITDAETFRAIAEARPEAWQIVLQRGGRVFRSYVSG